MQSICCGPPTQHKMNNLPVGSSQIAMLPHYCSLSIRGLVITLWRVVWFICTYQLWPLREHCCQAHLIQTSQLWLCMTSACSTDSLQGVAYDNTCHIYTILMGNLTVAVTDQDYHSIHFLLALIHLCCYMLLL